MTRLAGLSAALLAAGACALPQTPQVAKMDEAGFQVYLENLQHDAEDARTLALAAVAEGDLPEDALPQLAELLRSAAAGEVPVKTLSEHLEPGYQTAVLAILLGRLGRELPVGPRAEAALNVVADALDPQQPEEG